MLTTLNNIDHTIFFFINVKLANPITDFIMPIITSDNLLRLLYALAMIIILWKGNARLRWMVLFSALVLLFTDQISAHYLKNWIARIRPCHTLCPALNEINLLVKCGGGFSMPSSHATNAFGQAGLFGYFYKKSRWYLYTFAFLIAISRVFVGVHYPADVLVGIILGFLLGLMGAWGFKKFEILVLKLQKKKD